MDVKQVIVIRKDLKMRRGKEIAQSCHASLAFLTRQIQGCDIYNVRVHVSDVVHEWINSSFKKVCLQVESEQALLDIFDKAKEANLEVHLVTDNGLTEFNGIPTKTCLAIGPDLDTKIDLITGHLKLY